MPVMNQPAGYLLSGQMVSGVPGDWIDLRACAPYGYLQYATPAQSAVFTLQVSVDRVDAINALTVSASNTTGTAQISAFYPFMRAVPNAIYSGGGNTGFPVVHYTPGVK